MNTDERPDRLATGSVATGSLAADRVTTTVYGTDNSIYQLEPAGVLTPKTVGEIATLLRSNALRSAPEPIVARGGGTGTNGQSLTDGLMIDLKRHMHRIVDLDLTSERVTVEPGVVTAELNATLKEHGLFWPPHTSTLNRATVGGMISTDAAGKGSLLYGRTHRHVESLEMLLADGTAFTAAPTPIVEARRLAAEPGAVGELWTGLLAVADALDDVDLELPELARGFSGYGLDRLVGSDDTLDPVALVCGAEGTLGVITSATLRLTPLPLATLLVVASYDSFADALDDAVELGPLTRPAAIESFDETTLERGRSSPAWPALGAVVGEHRGSVLLLEYSGDSMPDPAPIMAALEQTGRHLAATTITDQAGQSAAWKVRADAVGLLAKVATGGPERSARPIAFVEDCAVPVANMAAFIAGFRAILDEAGVEYGMFGHADVGCVHVRPALDLTDDDHVAMVRSITDRVVTLVAHHGGVLWGEHGRGFRGDSVEAFLSPDTIGRMRAVKTAFDPLDICNPGKLYRPLGVDEPIVGVEAPPLRGQANARIPLTVRNEFDSAFACNGNGLCHHYDGAEVMCPSFKATGDPALSPKGRADLIRAWLADEEAAGSGSNGADDDFADAIAANLHQCLSCSACTGRCPVEVDIPEMKSRFLERHHRTRRRPIAHTALARFEELATITSRVPRLAKAGAGLAGRALGLVDLPSPQAPVAHGAPIFDRSEISVAARTADTTAGNTTEIAAAGRFDAVIVPDVFTTTLEPSTLAAGVAALASVGFEVAVAPSVPSGKFDHVKGRRSAFRAAVAKQRSLIDDVVRSGAVPVVIEPATGLLHSHEYQTFDTTYPGAAVRHIVDLLHERRDRLPAGSGERLVLLGHCTERATRPASLTRWVEVLEAAGYGVEAPALGCCGMAGIFGHERDNQQMSRDLWDRSWQPALDATEAIPVATGYSCRSQAKRFGGVAIDHPLAVLHRSLSS